jgi:hypothetical protein
MVFLDSKSEHRNKLTKRAHFWGKGGVTDSYVCAGTQQDENQSFHIAFGVVRVEMLPATNPNNREATGRQQGDKGKPQGDNREATRRQQGDSRETTGRQRTTTRRQQGNKRDTKGRQRETKRKQTKGDEGKLRET